MTFEENIYMLLIRVLIAIFLVNGKLVKVCLLYFGHHASDMILIAILLLCECACIPTVYTVCHL